MSETASLCLAVPTANSSNQPFSQQSQCTIHHRNHQPLQSELWGSTGLFRRTCQGCKNLAEINCWSTVLMGTSSYQPHKQMLSTKLLKAKNDQNDESSADVVVAVPHYLEDPVAKPSMQSTSSRFSLSSWWFSRQKGPDWCPRKCFFNRTLSQSTLLPPSGSPNGGEGVRIIRHCPCSQDFAQQQRFFFLCWRIKLELAGLSLSQESFRTAVTGSSEPSSKRSSPTPSGCGWTAAKSASGSVVIRPKRVPK